MSWIRIGLISLNRSDPSHRNLGASIWADCHICAGASEKLVDTSLLQLFYRMCLSHTDALDAIVYLRWQEARVLWHFSLSFQVRRDAPAFVFWEMGAEQSGLPGLGWRQSPLVVLTGVMAQSPHPPETRILGWEKLLPWIELFRIIS